METTALEQVEVVAEGGSQLAKALGMGSLALAITAALLVWVLLKVGFIGMAVWFEVSYPQASKRMAGLYRDNGKKCILVGLVNLVAGIALVLLLLATKVLGLLGLLLFAVLVALCTIGYAVAYLNLGLRLGMNGADTSPARAIIKGGVAAESAFMVPILGQLLSLGMLLRGLGAVALEILGRRRAAPEAVAAPPANSE